MSYRQPKYIAPADANIAIEKFNDSMKAFADEAKNQKQLQFCRENPGACEDDNREAKDSTDDTSTKTSQNVFLNKMPIKPPSTVSTSKQGKLQLLNNPMSADMEKYMINQEAQFRK